jgi:hypothetical protein
VNEFLLNYVEDEKEGGNLTHRLRSSFLFFCVQNKNKKQKQNKLHTYQYTSFIERTTTTTILFLLLNLDGFVQSSRRRVVVVFDDDAAGCRFQQQS